MMPLGVDMILKWIDMPGRPIKTYHFAWLPIEASDTWTGNKAIIWFQSYWAYSNGNPTFSTYEGF